MRLAALRKHLSYANVIATIALFAALGGGAYAAITLPKNSVGQKQIKKNAVTGKKVKNRSLTGADVNLTKLGKVPSAATADRATSAGTADTATTATTASNLAAPEDWHEVGAPGEPPFAAGASNYLSPNPESINFETAAFYKDREGVVHLKGMVRPSAADQKMFFFPAGYRPRSKTLIELIASCRGCDVGTSPGGDSVVINSITVQIIGSGYGPTIDGQITAANGPVSLNGLTFRAGS
jgi:hypothetical protein